MEQKHLDHIDTVNMGSFYTPERIVDIVYKLIAKHVPDSGEYYILDTSCGYGGFLRGANVHGCKILGADVDACAVRLAKQNSDVRQVFHHNSLLGVSRTQYGLNKDAKIIVVGNPPYNDTTSMIRNNIKQERFERDADIVSRDVGISFLLSYNKLAAGFVCVLHPLSYLIKKANFEALGAFKNNYKLTDSVIISSGVFSATSKTTAFPIIIAFYERSLFGMTYNDIMRYKFTTDSGKTFSIGDYDVIGNYIAKYPNHKTVTQADTAAYFYTMRDINALKRTATFLEKETTNAVRVTKDKLPYYCYVDVFKDYIPHIPYYFGNSDIMIDHDRFCEMQPEFVSRSVRKHPQLRSVLAPQERVNAETKITAYFKQLIGEHYED